MEDSHVYFIRQSYIERRIEMFIVQIFIITQIK